MLQKSILSKPTREARPHCPPPPPPPPVATALNLLERNAIKALGITVDKFFFSRTKAISLAEIDRDLQSTCSKLCDDYADLFKSELGCLRDVELEMNHVLAKVNK